MVKTFLRSLFVLLLREFLLSRSSYLSLSLKNPQPFSVLETVASPPFPLVSLELRVQTLKLDLTLMFLSSSSYF